MRMCLDEDRQLEVLKTPKNPQHIALVKVRTLARVRVKQAGD